jgi:hypothetical protein
MSEARTEVVQVRMREDTLDQLDDIKNKVNAASRSDAVRRAVGLTDILISEIYKGKRILLEDKKGRQTQIFITGLPK